LDVLSSVTSCSPKPQNPKQSDLKFIIQNKLIRNS